jgi:SAM-dependent methyltransferase
MISTEGGYADWNDIDYQPAIPELLPEALVPFFRRDQTALEIGSGHGAVCFFLARHGLDALGIDINPDAISAARRQVASSDSGLTVRFDVADFLEQPDVGLFDFVLMIRVLTCFPGVDSWQALLRRAYACVKPGGMIYIHDFLFAPQIEGYRRRYERGKELGWRNGNFAVNDAKGRLLFIAHHHSKEEVDQIIAPYQMVSIQSHESLSMNGNPCRMFEFLGRKPT